jgi:hypothetical protein
MEIPVFAESGCIKNVTVREAAFYIVGQGTVSCVPDINVTGFYVCSQEISGTIKSGSCWIEEAYVAIKETGNACDDHTQVTKCQEPYAYCVCDEGSYTITPVKDDNHSNGVTTYDLVLISKHILGLEPFNSPYKMIAADVNKSGSVTTFDIVEARKLILGTYNEFPDNTSWRFLPRELVLGTNNPFPSFEDESSEKITAEIDNNGIAYSYDRKDFNPPNSIITVSSTTADFVGIKVGDVNCTAINCGVVCADCATYPQRPTRPGERFLFEVPGTQSEPGETIILPVYAGSEQPLIAYQSGLRFDPARFEFIAISAGDVTGFTPDCISLNEAATGKIKVLWLSLDHESNYLQPGQVLFYVALRTKSKVRGNEMILVTDDAIFQNLGYTSNNLEIPLKTQLRLSNRQHAQEPDSSPLAVSCSPNPSSGAVELSLLSEAPASARVFVFGPYGVRMFYREIELSKGANSLPIREVADWVPGIYTWQVQAGEEKLTGRFVRQ